MPYGVTDFAEGFAGAISVPAEVLTAILRAIATRLLADGWTHVCLVNNHLEPAHDAAVRAAIDGLAARVGRVLRSRGDGRARCPTSSRRGDCHAGRYETSLVLAAGARVKEEHRSLPPVGISLADAIRAGNDRFRAIGMDRAYTGAPAEATAQEGDLLYEKLVDMIVGEVTDGLAR